MESAAGQAGGIDHLKGSAECAGPVCSVVGGTIPSRSGVAVRAGIAGFLRLGQSPELETDLVVVNGLTVSLDVRIASQSALPASRIHGIPHLVVRRVTMRG